MYRVMNSFNRTIRRSSPTRERFIVGRRARLGRDFEDEGISFAVRKPDLEPYPRTSLAYGCGNALGCGACNPDCGLAYPIPTLVEAGDRADKCAADYTFTRNVWVPAALALAWGTSCAHRHCRAHRVRTPSNYAQYLRGHTGHRPDIDRGCAGDWTDRWTTVIQGRAAPCGLVYLCRAA